MNTRSHIPEIDSLRALAIGAVVGFHYSKEYFPATESVLLYGWSGVDLFFVISGFVLFLQFKRRYLKQGSTDYATYARNRFVRIAPAYYASLLSEVLIFHPVNLLSTTMLAHVSFMHMISYETAYSIQPVYWTLAVEAQFYLFLILAGRLFLNRAGYIVIGLLLMVCLAYRFLVSFHFGYTPAGVLLINHLPGRLPEFMWGILLAKIYSREDYWRPIATTRVVLATALISGLAIYGATAYHWLRGKDAIFGSVWVSTFFHPVTGLGLMLTALPLLASRGRMRALVLWKPLMFTGAISYSLYLWHMFAIRILSKVVGINSYPWPATVKLGVALVLTLSLATLSYRYIEKPFLAYRKG